MYQHIYDPTSSLLQPIVYSQCPDGQIFYVENGNDTATVSWVPPAIMSVYPATTQVNYEPGSQFPVGDNRVVYSTVDAEGNTAGCIFGILVVVLSPCSNGYKNPYRAKDSAGLNQVLAAWTSQGLCQGTITLKPQLPTTFYLDKAVNWDSGGNIAIEGKSGLVTLSVASPGRLFNVTGYGVLTLKGLTITGGEAIERGGGAIRLTNHSTVHLIQSSLINNTAPVGGAISARDSSIVNITKCTMERNMVTDSSSYGGAVFVLESQLLVTRSAFQQNIADGGGAVCVGFGSTADITRSTFNENKCQGMGGCALFAESSAVTVTGCKFADNRGVEALGGAIRAVAGSKFHVSNCIFRNNSIIGQSSFGGGAIALYSCPYFQVEDSKFISNSALTTLDGEDVSRGGAIAIWGDDSLNNQAEVTRCLFRSNTAIRGGAIGFAYGGLKVKQSNFTSNVASEKGAAVISDYATTPLVFEDSIFAKNVVTGGTGGALNLKTWSLGRAKVVSCTFKKNLGGCSTADIECNEDFTCIDSPSAGHTYPPGLCKAI